MSKHAMKVSPILIIILALISFSLPACNKQKVERKAPKIVITSPQIRTVTIPQEYSCQIRAQRHIKIRAVARGNVEAIAVKDGQRVKEGDLIFKVKPALKQARRDVAPAEADLAQRESDFSKKLSTDKEFSQNESVAEARRARSVAKAQLAAAELNLETIKAPFDGVVDGLHLQVGSLVQDGEILATLSDSSLIWAYFNVPEARYLDFMTDPSHPKEDLQIELILANGKKFEQIGKLGSIDANFNKDTGTIAFRADFPNPDRVLRHGQTGVVSIRRVLNDALVIPQRATFELLNKRYVYVVDKDNIVHRREIVIQYELDDLFVIKSGLSLEDKIVLEGNRQVFDGEKVECEEFVQKQE